MSFRLEKKLMALLIGELYYLIFDRRAISRTDSFDLSGVKRRLMKIIANRLMQPSRLCSR
jgi:hypothetical protein